MALSCRADEKVHCDLSSEARTQFCHCKPQRGSVAELEEKRRGSSGWLVVMGTLGVLGLIISLFLIIGKPKQSPGNSPPPAPEKMCEQAVKTMVESYTRGLETKEVNSPNFLAPERLCLQTMAHRRYYDVSLKGYKERQSGMILLWVSLGILVLGLVMALIQYSYYTSQIAQSKSSTQATVIAYTPLFRR